MSLKGETGEEVPLGDVKAYAAAIDRLLSDNERYMRYAAAGKDRIARMFTCELAVSEADKLFHQLLSEE